MKFTSAALTILAIGVMSGAPAMAAKPSQMPTPSPASGTGLSPDQCFQTRDIRNHTIGDRDTLLLSVQGKGAYRVTMKGSCLAGATSSDPIVTRSPPGAQRICRPIDMDIAISRDSFASPCIVDSIVKMSPEEVAALPKRLKP
jgi:hypothetical protein